MAWLNAAPKPAEGTKRAQAKDRPPAISRIDQLKRRKIRPPMPPNPAPHIISRLIEIGLTEAAGMGSAPVSWQSIQAWSQLTGTRLAPWEARLIRKLSLEYLAEGRRAESESCPPPWRGEVTQRERETEVAQLCMVLG
jgi:hypothetical protein